MTDDARVHYEAERVMIRARKRMLIQQPFYGFLCLEKLRLVADPGLPHRMSCNGRVLKYNPEKVLETNADDLLTHIALHVTRCVAGHPWRRRGRDTKTWDAAGEFAVSGLLKKDGFKLPEDVLYAEAMQDRSAEQVYRDIYMPTPPSKGKEDDEDGDGGGHGEGSGDSKPGPEASSHCEDAEDDKPPKENEPGKPEDGTAPDANDGGGSEQFDWQISAIQASMMASRAGMGSPGAQELIDSQRQPPVDWRMVTQDFVQQVARADYDWSMPNRRYIQGGVYLPSLRSKQLGEILLVIDTSGSTQGARDKFADNYNAIEQHCEPACTHVLYWDDRFQHYERKEHNDPVKALNMKGNGGTVMTNVFRWVEANGIEPCCCIFLTDLDFTGPFPKEPHYPVLWAVTGRYGKNPGSKRPRYGEVLCIDED